MTFACSTSSMGYRPCLNPKKMVMERMTASKTFFRWSQKKNRSSGVASNRCPLPSCRNSGNKPTTMPRSIHGSSFARRFGRMVMRASKRV